MEKNVILYHISKGVIYIQILLNLFLIVFFINFFIIIYSIYTFFNLNVFRNKQGSKLKLKTKN